LKHEHPYAVFAVLGMGRADGPIHMHAPLSSNSLMAAACPWQLATHSAVSWVVAALLSISAPASSSALKLVVWHCKHAHRHIGSARGPGMVEDWANAP
jgi:hypothetical protein